MSKMIEIKGRQFSEDTIAEALKAYAGFEPYEFKAGDVIKDDNDGDIRIVFSNYKNSLETISLYGKEGMSAKKIQNCYNYRKIGVISDFIVESLIDK